MRYFYRLIMGRQVQKLFKAQTPWKHNGKTWHNDTKTWTSHILYICVCLHVQNMSQELNPGDPKFLLIQENNCITIKTPTRTRNYRATTLSLEKHGS